MEFLIWNLSLVLNVVCFLLGNSPASEIRRQGITQKKAYNNYGIIKNRTDFTSIFNGHNIPSMSQISYPSVHLKPFPAKLCCGRSRYQIISARERLSNAEYIFSLVTSDQYLEVFLPVQHLPRFFVFARPDPCTSSIQLQLLHPNLAWAFNNSSVRQSVNK
jgi:hypothetical protein